MKNKRNNEQHRKAMNIKDKQRKTIKPLKT